MGKYFFALVLAVFVTTCHGFAFAQESFKDRLAAMNRTQMTQTRHYRTDSDMFAMRVLDTNRQFIGDVADIRLDENGAVAVLISEINRIGRRESLVEHKVGDIVFRPEVSAFEISLGIAETGDVTPESLAAIAPAAGGGSLYSLKAMAGAEVRHRDGRWLGRVKHVVFDEKGLNAAALLIDDVPGASRYREFALPFDPGQVKMNSDYGRVEFRIEPEGAKSLMDFAKSFR